MITSPEELGRFIPQALTERMREYPHRLHALGLIALDDIMQAQMTPDHINHTQLGSVSLSRRTMDIARLKV
jgi:hypothetical protein